jgi:hypothetical protein
MPSNSPSYAILNDDESQEVVLGLYGVPSNHPQVMMLMPKVSLANMAVGQKCAAVARDGVRYIIQRVS